VVKFLVENGADINARPNGSDGTALWWAKKKHGDDHPVVSFLEGLGALAIGPDL
jgi:prolyl 4-hydroxylase